MQNLKQSKAAGTNDYVDYGIRMAHAFSPKLAAKANFTYMRGIGMLQIMTIRPLLEEIESCEL
jgi:hypothetical protein